MKGLTQLNVNDPKAILQTTTVSDELCDDLSTVGDTLFARSATGLSQYSLKTSDALTRLSIITFVK